MNLKWGWTIVIVLGMVLSVPGGTWAKGKVVSASTQNEGNDLDELENGSKASAGDGMDQSRFGADEDDTYTDDSDTVDDLNKSKFQDEKNDEGAGTDTSDQDAP
jgi:hypothetical protein